MLSIDPANYSRRLAIIVPYRNRAEHLAIFLPHMITYFERDKLDRAINYSIHIVEQVEPQPFNRGKLINCGFALANHNADYVVFHDVDYLPIWADYSFTPQPTRLIWHGLVLREDYEKFFGAVVGISCEHLRLINGFSNNYWHWGAEDMDLNMRCRTAGLVPAKRDGTYQPLKHQHNGLLPGGQPRPEVIPNFQYFQQHWPAGVEHKIPDEGLSTLKYTLVETRPVRDATHVLPHVHHHFVRI